MEELPAPGGRIKIPFSVPVRPRWLDHRLAVGAVLPAVEALQLLARTLPAGGGAPLVQEEAVFGHLLLLPPSGTELALVHEFSRDATGKGCSRLLSLRRGRQSGLLRPVEHAAVRFGVPVRAAAPAPALSGIGDEEAFRLPAEGLYEALVPFGAAYRNVTGEVVLTPRGAWAWVSGGEDPEACGPLGSPYPLDGAMHLACAWVQRYGGQVTFPVAFAHREIRIPTRAEGRYLCEVAPGTPGRGGWSFTVTLTLPGGEVAEVVEGLAMRPLARERRSPPAWVREGR